MDRDLDSQASQYQELQEVLQDGQPRLTMSSSIQLVLMIQLTDSHSTTVMLHWVTRDKLRKEWQDAQTLLKTSPSRLILGEMVMRSKELTSPDSQVALILVSLPSQTASS